MSRVRIAIVIPCYKVKKHILNVLNEIGEEVSLIYVIDDFCPENTGDYVISLCKDKRVKVIKNKMNMGVGGAVIVGYKAAILDDAEVIVKIDGDEQMNPKLVNDFVRPIINGEADYTKGNRFFNLESLLLMPRMRILGNAALSFITKLSSGYWNLFDPTNGYTAIHASVAKYLPLEKIDKRYFFETDILFRLNILRAVVVDIPMDSVYGNEVSNLKISNAIGSFFIKHIKTFFKRLFYNYYLRDMSIGSIELPIGLVMLIFGISYGAINWTIAFINHENSATGTIVLSSMLIILGTQFILAFLANDINSIPHRPIHLNSLFKKNKA